MLLSPNYTRHVHKFDVENDLLLYCSDECRVPPKSNIHTRMHASMLHFHLTLNMQYRMKIFHHKQFLRFIYTLRFFVFKKAARKKRFSLGSHFAIFHTFIFVLFLILLIKRVGVDTFVLVYPPDYRKYHYKKILVQYIE